MPSALYTATGESRVQISARERVILTQIWISCIELETQMTFNLPGQNHHIDKRHTKHKPIKDKASILTKVQSYMLGLQGILQTLLCMVGLHGWVAWLHGWGFHKKVSTCKGFVIPIFFIKHCIKRCLRKTWQIKKQYFVSEFNGDAFNL